MINLGSVCLVAIGSTRIKETLKAIQQCQKYCNFGQSLYLTEKYNHKENLDLTFLDIPPIKSIKDYQFFIVKKLPQILLNFDFNHFLTINWDGFIVNPNAWTKLFLEYDYIGAPWPWLNHVCGNGGFNLKSKKFLSCQHKIFQHTEHINEPEDLILSYYYRKDFMDLGCEYAPPKLAYQFSTEHGGYNNYNSFGFHDFLYNSQFKSLIL